MIAPAWIIQKKRDGKELSQEEILSFIQGVSSGKIPDYQATALLMAIFFQGMTLDETVSLTRAMLASGVQYDLSSILGPKIDKHSTGGVGDKVSLILAPLAAACGISVPMMSGRGLGHSGGTLDKLESIAGFRVGLEFDEFLKVLKETGCAMIGQSAKIAPADRKLYALRDVTGTVECIPLITASILSKKLAEGSRGLILDVKVGSGAFMKTREQARKLARTLIQVAKKMDLPCRALLTDMSQPLGYAVGNALEVEESISLLRNHRRDGLISSDLKELTLQLCAHMLVMAERARTLAEGRRLAMRKLEDGSAWKIFRKLVELQGGSLEQILQPEKLPSAPLQIPWRAREKGYLSKIDTEVVGRILVELGGGRKTAADSVDPAVGLIFHKKLGSRVQCGEPIATVHARSELSANGGPSLPELEEKFLAAIEVSNMRKTVPKLVYECL